ncbi:MAG: Hsp20/alpha crystallin family protein [Lachnospiraceae bacterium]|uniref:Hsp20/alpha crystallin family protein n=1 Tax=Candidatus Merdisoma sp. JLR.KK006 TaxID=3112626 RepID=UPI002FF1A43D|nr:Hsp20/alpha crystallin family protein [Lachnospiraceae bacterium]
MMMPSIFGNSLFDEWMDFPFDSGFSKGSKRETSLMKTDVKEMNGAYELEMELPGYAKEDVTAQLKDGYLTIQASRNATNDEKDEKGNYIRRERYIGQCSRSFYVGETVKQEDIRAKFENGILKLTVPKIEEQKPVEENKFIAIEG